MAAEHLKQYWEDYRNGKVKLKEGHGVRGKDKNPRNIPGSKTLATRYFEQTGRRIDQEMADQQAMIQMMFDAASRMEDDQERFNALSKVTAEQAKFNSQWAPFLEQKLGTLQSDMTVEQHKSLDDVLNEAIEGDKPLALENEDED